MLERQRCQRHNVLGEHALVERVRWQLDRGLGIKSGLIRALGPARTPAPRVGRPSRFEEQSWVRVLDRAQIEATLDARSRLRGLVWVPAQWDSVGGVYRVLKHVRRIRDDHGRMRAVSGTVLLEGVTCAGRDGTAGCGRHCPLMFRDEWLTAADAPVRASENESGSFARVRPVAEIRATLDAWGRHDGLMFVPEMERHAGSRLRIARRLGPVFENDHWLATRGAIYILQGVQCSGAVLGAIGPCDRACALLWHGDWIELEE